jgi:hypothetical protein
VGNAHRDPEPEPAGELRHELAAIDRELPWVELADIVRLKKPYGLKIDRQKGPFTFGIVAEILTVLPDGRTRDVSLYLYDPGRKEIFLGPNGIPELCRRPHNSGNAGLGVMWPSLQFPCYLPRLAAVFSA